MSSVAVFGAGSWGTTLAIHFAQQGHDVRLWGNDRPQLADLQRDRMNVKFLAGIPLPAEVKVQPELEVALEGADFHFYVVPSQAVRSVAGGVDRVAVGPQAASHGLLNPLGILDQQHAHES